MTPRWILAAFGACAFVAVTAAHPAGSAEGDAAVAPAVIHVDTADHPNVELTLAVPGPDGGELTAKDVELRENGDERDVKVVPAGGDSLEVLLLIDTSGSMKGAALISARAAAAQFISKLPAETRVGLVGFGPSPSVVVAPTTDRGPLLGALDGLVARGDTALYDAVDAALQIPIAKGAQRSIVVLSDGGDTASFSTLDIARGKVATSGTHLDIVGLTTSESDPAAISALAAAGGGRVVSVDDTAALSDAYDGLAAALAHRYTVSYTSKAYDTAKLALEVEVGGESYELGRSVKLPAAPPPPPSAAKPAGSEAPAAAAADEASSARTLLWAAAATVFAAIVILLLVALTPGELRLQDRLGALRNMKGKRRTTGTVISELQTRTGEFADRQLEKQGRKASLNSALERAGIDMRPGEFVIAAFGVALAAALVGLIVAGPVLGIIALAVAVMGAYGYVSAKATQRSAQFNDQLADTLQLIGGTLRAGYALQQALDVVARDAPSPTREEFMRALTEVRLGRDLSSALHDIVDRTRSDDFGLVVEAIAMHREVGGDLSELLDRVAETVRERAALYRQVKALSAEGRMSAWVLLGLPFVVLLFLRWRNPDYLGELTGSPAGIAAIGLGLIFMGAGYVWLKKITRLVY